MARVVVMPEELKENRLSTVVAMDIDRSGTGRFETKSPFCAMGHNGFETDVHGMPATLRFLRLLYMGTCRQSVVMNSTEWKKTQIWHLRMHTSSTTIPLFSAVPRRRGRELSSPDDPGSRRSRSSALLHHQRLHRRSATLQKPVGYLGSWRVLPVLTKFPCP